MQESKLDLRNNRYRFPIEFCLYGRTDGQKVAVLSAVNHSSPMSMEDGGPPRCNALVLTRSMTIAYILSLKNDRLEKKKNNKILCEVSRCIDLKSKNSLNITSEDVTPSNRASTTSYA